MDEKDNKLTDRENVRFEPWKSRQIGSMMIQPLQIHGGPNRQMLQKMDEIAPEPK